MKTANDILQPYIKTATTGFGTFFIVDVNKALMAMEEYAQIRESDAYNRGLKCGGEYWAEEFKSDESIFMIAKFKETWNEGFNAGRKSIGKPLDEIRILAEKYLKAHTYNLKEREDLEIAINNYNNVNR